MVTHAESWLAEADGGGDSLAGSHVSSQDLPLYRIMSAQGVITKQRNVKMIVEKTP